MAWQKGFNFRDTSGFVTDGANETYVSADAYPTIRNSVTFGWQSGPTILQVDRDAGNDRRLAGINYTNPPDNIRFQIDVPAPGDYDISLAEGDAAAGHNGQTCKIYDDATLKATIGPKNCSAQEFMDTAATVYSNLTWPGSNTAGRVTLATTTLILEFGDNGFNIPTIAHVFVSQVEAPAGFLLVAN